MACSLCDFRNSTKWIALFLPFLVSAPFLGCGFSLPLLFTALFITLSSIIFTCSRHKPVEKSMPELKPETEKTVTQEDGKNDCMGRPLDSYSESESIDQSSSITDQDSEAEWPCSGDAAQSWDFSDGSISDEEGLIEIALPSGHYVGAKKEEPKKEEPKLSLQRKPPDQLVELLADFNEANEEDNLIEIDISVGSIKSSSDGLSWVSEEDKENM